MNCAREVDTPSARSRYFCNTPQCQWAAKRKPKIKRDNATRFRLYGQRTEKLKRLWRKRGLTCDVHGI